MKREVLGEKGTKTRNLNRRRAIRHYCLMCSGFDWAKVTKCHAKECLLYDFRLGRLNGSGHHSEERAKAIVTYCTWCSDEDARKREACDAPHCSLFPYRNG
jgi:hypothetical protein